MDILEHTFSLKEILATPYPYICTALLSYFVGGKYFTRGLVRWMAKYNKKHSVRHTNADNPLTSDDQLGVVIARCLFPISVPVIMLSILFAYIFQFTGKKCNAYVKKMDTIAKEAYKKG